MCEWEDTPPPSQSATEPAYPWIVDPHVLTMLLITPRLSRKSRCCDMSALTIASSDRSALVDDRRNESSLCARSCSFVIARSNLSLSKTKCYLVWVESTLSTTYAARGQLLQPALPSRIRIRLKGFNTGELNGCEIRPVVTMMETRRARERVAGRHVSLVVFYAPL
jgi:hypothetical protein